MVGGGGPRCQTALREEDTHLAAGLRAPKRDLAHHRKIVSVPLCRGAFRGQPAYGHPWAMANQTMASARMRFTRVRTRSQPCISQSQGRSSDVRVPTGCSSLAQIDGRVVRHEGGEPLAGSRRHEEQSVLCDLWSDGDDGE